MKKMKAVLSNAIRKGLILSGYLVAQRATRNAPRDTGRLKRSIMPGKPYKVRGKNRWAIDVGTNVEYAAAQELGSGLFAEKEVPRLIHITPVKKKALAFVWPGAPAGMADEKTGKVVLASVWSKGVKPQPYLRPALNQSIPTIKALLLGALMAELKKL